MVKSPIIYSWNKDFRVALVPYYQPAPFLFLLFSQPWATFHCSPLKLGVTLNFNKPTPSFAFGVLRKGFAQSCTVSWWQSQVEIYFMLSIPYEEPVWESNRCVKWTFNVELEPSSERGQPNSERKKKFLGNSFFGEGILFKAKIRHPAENTLFLCNVW